MTLAFHGGQPTSTRPWPRWPRVGETGRRLVNEVLASDRWSISGPWSGAETLDQRASRAFAEFCGVEYAFTVDHGSSALVAAFLALGIGAGDEIIIPGLTWAACASAVMRVNAVPVPVDVSPRTLCIDPSAVERAVTARTKAVLIVHLYGSMADLDALAALARRTGLILIEDCAQAHGAEWDGVRAGATGTIGTFSFHQGKPMAAGEGGMVVTSDRRLARKLEQIRCDGRRYAPARPGHQHLAFAADLQGFNFCMPEASTALLLDALERFDEENARRAENARLLDERLARTNVWNPVPAYPKNQRRTYYHYAVQVDPGAFDDAPIERICEAIEAELGTPVTPPYPSMDAFELVKPEGYSAWSKTEWTERAARHGWDVPCARRASRTTVLLHHSVLLCEPERVGEIADAFEKVALRAADLSPMPAAASA
jgi:dTDP-4-amino-4,6-dideoxygalactose transaminase